MSENGIVEIHGREYQTVALRIHLFRMDHPDWGVSPEIIEITEERVLMKTTITDEYGRTLGVGHAEEVRASSNINRSSAVENCETSSIGRALASIGYGGMDYRSADEMEQAVHQQELQRTAELEAAKKKHADTITAIKDGITEGNLSIAAEAWFELDNEEKKSIWVAPSKGGPFSTEERKIMQSNEFREAHYGTEETAK